MSELACGHTKIKEITWHEDNATAGKFMCLDCNTDFVPLTQDIREFLRHKQWEESYAEQYERKGNLQRADKSMYTINEEDRRASRARHGVDCSCSSC